MRYEISISNESDALVFADAALHGSGIAPGDAGWDVAIAARRVLAVWLESEDPSTVRIVIDEPLDEDEKAQWVGVVRSVLAMPNGRLALCGGVAWLLDSGNWTAPFAQVVEIGAGQYRADLYCHLASPVGRWCAQQAENDEPLGSWFRRRCPAAPMPVWLHNRCVDDPSLDPGRAAQWRRATELPGGEVVDFVLHLTSLDDSSPTGPAHLPEDGLWLPRNCRKPEPFPLGLPLAGKALTFAPPIAVANARAQVPKWHLQALARHAAKLPLRPLQGGAVELPLAHLPRIARIAWMCCPYTHPGLRISVPSGVPRWREIEDVEITLDNDQTQVSFVFHEQPADALFPLTAFSAQLTGLPNATSIELICARPGHGGAAGLQQWHGSVLAGAWIVEAAAPAVDALCVKEALALIADLESGRRLHARDPDEGVRILERVQRELQDCFGANELLLDGSTLVLRKRNNALFELICARVFWMRYAKTWPLQDPDSVRG